MRWLLATGDPAELVAMVNAVKTKLSSRWKAGPYFASTSSRRCLSRTAPAGAATGLVTTRELLEFRDSNLQVSPVATPGLRAGNPWKGPRASGP